MRYCGFRYNYKKKDMEIKAINQNQTIKNIYIKNNNEWNKFETSSTDKPNDKIVLNNDLKFSYNTGTTIDVSNYDTSNVTDMQYMFYQCNGSEISGLNNWNTSNVTSMGSMFSSCSGLTSLDLSSFDTSKVINMNSMFNYCRNLSNTITIDFHNNKVNIAQLFSTCNNLTEITLKNTLGLNDYYNTFKECIKLRTINGELDLFNVTGTSLMFHNNKELVDVKVKNLGRINYSNSISFWASSKLSKESVLYLFNNAFDRASSNYQIFTIDLHADTKALLTESDIAIATAKGYTIA